MAQGRKTALTISLTSEEREKLDLLVRSHKAAAARVKRGRIILLFAVEKQSISDIARAVKMGRNHIYKWIKRFLESGIDGLSDKEGRGRRKHTKAMAA